MQHPFLNAYCNDLQATKLRCSTSVTFKIRSYISCVRSSPFWDPGLDSQQQKLLRKGDEVALASSRADSPISAWLDAERSRCHGQDSNCWTEYLDGGDIDLGTHYRAQKHDACTPSFGALVQYLLLFFSCVCSLKGGQQAIFSHSLHLIQISGCKSNQDWRRPLCKEDLISLYSCCNHILTLFHSKYKEAGIQ